MSKQDRQGARTPAQLEQKYNFGETFSKTNESQSSQAYQINQLAQTLALFMASTNATLEALTQQTGGVSNALVGAASGDIITLADVSPIEHTLTVKLLSDTITDFSAVKVSIYREDENEAESYTPTEDGTVEGVLSLYPITNLSTDTEGVVIEVTYNRDLNKAFAELIASNERG